MLKTLRMRSYPIRYRFEGLLYRTWGDSAWIESLRNRHRGRPMLVVGNGPSLKRTPLDSFAEIPAIGMNKIDLLFDRVRWRPFLILAVNTPVVQQHWRAMAAHEVDVALAWKARYLVPSHERRKFRFFHVLPGGAFSHDLHRGVGAAATVSYGALQFAYWCGADPVILFGIDHSFQHSGKALDYQVMGKSDPNHFDPRYFAGQKWGVPDLEASEASFVLARAAFEADGRRVLDATIDGKLTVFDKIDLENALKLCDMPATMTDFDTAQPFATC